MFNRYLIKENKDGFAYSLCTCDIEYYLEQNPDAILLKAL